LYITVTSENIGTSNLAQTLTITNSAWMTNHPSLEVGTIPARISKRDKSLDQRSS